MILIFTTLKDNSSGQVIDWLEYFGANFKRINSDEMDLLQKPVSLCTNNSRSFNFDSISTNEKIVGWYRRSSIPAIYIDTTDKEEEQFNYNIHTSLRQEYKEYVNSIYASLEGAKWLNSPKKIYINKFDQLLKAKQFNLNIPDTIITTDKKDILEFAKEKKFKIIAKPISSAGTFINKKGETYKIFTKKVTSKNLNKLNNSIFPCLFQEYIEKEYEIRVFYIENNFYSMAIFSQDDEKTKIDFRNYNDVKPNRNVPYLLPKEIVIKLKKFANYFNVNCGSFDLIKSKDGLYYFLELNPVGQFGMVSGACNYMLEKKIAQFLMTHDEK